MALTGNQREAAALAIACGKNVKAAAEATGVGERTLHRWLRKDPLFQQRVDELREELFDKAAGRLSDMSVDAAETLGELLKSSDEKIRLQAARLIIENACTLRQSTEFSNRLGAMEKFIEERSDTCAD
jgi:hypothetical protein